MKRITLIAAALLTLAGTLSMPATAEAKARHHHRAVASVCAAHVVGGRIIYPAGCVKPVPAPGLPPKTI